MEEIWLAQGYLLAQVLRFKHKLYLSKPVGLPPLLQLPWGLL